MNFNHPMFDNHIGPSSLLISVNHNPMTSQNRNDWDTSNYSKPVSCTVTKNLRLQIHNIHLSYIIRDESTFKSKWRRKVENLINKYLTLIPHIEKFTFKEIRDCLEMTIKKSTFDPQKVIAAFETIERYATNLLNYPWRHEYHKIFAFNGFFHRFIKCSLVGYEDILELLGYNYDSSLDIYKLIEIPIDPDKMIQISFDCLVLMVEMQIMLDIKSQCPEMTWKDIYSIRSEFICNIPNAIQLFYDLKRNNKLIDLDLDFPDYRVKKFDNKLDFLSQINGKNSNEILLPPPSNYLESDLDTIDFIDSASKSEQNKNTDSIVMDNHSISNNSSVHTSDISATNNKLTTIKINRNNLDPVILEQINHFEKNSQNFVGNSWNRNSSTSMKKLDNKSNKVKNTNDKSVKHLKWSCQYCTFENSEVIEVCEMCHRSRTKGNESIPLTIGGRECNKCTLVNEKDEQFCTVCKTPLADSPTYI